MTWEIVLGIIALCGAAVTLGGVAVKLATTISRLDTTIVTLDKTISEIKVGNEREHCEIYGKLENHEGRINRIEIKEGIIK